MESRRTSIRVKYKNYDVSTSLLAFLLSFSYDESVDGESDVATLTLEDSQSLWQADLMPARGDQMTVSLVAADDEYSEVAPLGVMTIDEVEISMPPSVCKLKLNSMPGSAPIRAEDHSRSWEAYTLRQIAQDIADRAGMRLYFDCPDDAPIERAEQHDESDLTFLQKLCRDRGLLLKVTDEAIIICDYKKYEDKPPVCTLTRGVDWIENFTARATLTDVYKEAVVTYSSGKKKETITGSFADPNKSEGLTLRINKKVSDQAEAERLARKSLRDKNRNEVKVTMRCVGDLRLRAGATIELAGFHRFDGRYLINKAQHELSASGYVVSVELTRTLGY